MSTDSYYERNKEAIIKNVTRWRKENPEKCREYWRTFYTNNKSEIRTAQQRYRKVNPIKYLYSLAKRRAKRRGLDFTIELDDLFLPEYCPYLGVKLDSCHPEQGFHPSIDRIDPNKGYIKGNVEMISHRANMLKNNASAEELLLIALRMKGEIS